MEKKAPKGPRKSKEKKAGGGFTAPKFNAPTLSAPSISLSGPLGTLAFVLGSVGLFVGAALVSDIFFPVSVSYPCFGFRY